MKIWRLSPTGTVVSRLFVALMVLFTIGLAEAAKSKKFSKGGQRHGAGEQAATTQSEAARPAGSAAVMHADAATTQTSSTAVAALSPEFAARVDAATSTTTSSSHAPAANPMDKPLVVQPAKGPAPVDMNTTIVLSLNNVPLDQLVRFMAETTGKTIIKQRDLNTQVTVNAPKAVTKREALELIYGALQLENMYVAEQDDMIMLINQNSFRSIKIETIPATVDLQLLTDSNRLVQKIYKFQGIAADDVRRHLEVVMPGVSMSVEPRSNTLTLTDRLSRIRAYDSIITALDTPSDKVIEVYKLTKANASELMVLLRTMITNGVLTETTLTQTGTAQAPTSGTQAGELGSDVVLRQLRTGGAGEIVMIPDTRNNWIIALCPREQKAGLDRLVAEFDIGQSDDRIVQIYKPQYTDASQLLSLLTTIISNKGLSSATSSPGSGAALAALASGKGDHGHGNPNSNKYWKRLSEALAPGKAVTSGDVILLPEPRQNWIIAILRPELKPQLDELVKQFDIPRNQDVQLRIIDLKGGNAVTMASMISRLISDLPSSGPRDVVRVVPSEDNSRLMVMSSEANYKNVQSLIETIGTIPNDRVMEIYPVKCTEATQIVSLVNTIITNKGLGSAVSSGSGSGSGASGKSAKFLRRMGESGDSGRSGRIAPMAGDVMLVSESRLNWIIAIMRPDLKDSVEALIKQFDVPRVRTVKPHNLEVAPGTASATYSALYRVFSDLANNGTAADFVRIYPMDDGNHILVFCSDENLKNIQEVIKTIGTAQGDRTIEVFQIKNTDPSTLATLIARVLPVKGRTVTMSSSNGAADVALTYDQRLGWLIAIMKPEAKKDVEEVVKQFDVPKVQQVKAFKIPVEPGTASSTYYALYNIYSNLFSNSSPGDFARFYPAEDGNNVLVFCTEENLPRIQELVKSIGATPTDRTVQIYRMANADAYSVANLIYQTLPIKGKSVKIGAPGGDVSLTYEMRLNWLIAVMKPEMKKEIDELVKQFDVPKVRELQARTIDLKGGNAAFISATLTRILSDQPVNSTRDIIRVMPTEDNSKLIVTSTEANYKVVQDLIETIGIVPTNRVFEIYQLTNAEAGQVMSMITSIVTARNLGSVSGAASQLSPTNYSSYRSYSRHLAEAMATSGGQAVDLTMLPDTRLNWIIAVMKPELKPEIDALVKKFDVARTMEVQTRVLDLKGGNAASMASTLMRLIAGMPMDNSDDYIRIVPAEDNARLFVMSSEANFKMVEDLVATVGIVPNNRIFEIYKLKNGEPTQVMTMVQSIIQNRGLGTTSGAGSGISPSNYSSSRSYYRHLSESIGSSGGGQTADLMMIPDARLNWIVAIMKPELKKEVDALVAQFDEAKTMETQVRVIDLKGGNATTLANTLNKLVADMPVDRPGDEIKIMPADDNARLIVVSSEANYKVVQELIQTVGTITNNRSVEIYKLTYADPDAIIGTINSIITSKGLGTAAAGAASPSSSYSGSRSSYGGDHGRSYFMRRMMESMSSAAGGQSTDVLLIPDARLKWIVAIIKPELKPELDALVKQFDVESARQVEVRTIDLKDGNATQMVGMLSKLLVDEEMDDPELMARMVPSDDNTRIFITSNEANYKLVLDLIEKVGLSPATRDVEVYKLTYADPSALVQLVNSIIASRGLGTTASGAAPASSVSASSYGSFRQYYRRMADAAASGTQTADVVLIPDPRTKTVIAIVKPNLKTQVEALIKQFDTEPAREVQTRVVDLKGGNASVMAATLARLLEANDNDPDEMVRVIAADDNARLFVTSSEANYKMVQDLIQTIGIGTTQRAVEIYKLTYADPSVLIGTINSIIQNKGLGTTAAGAASPSSSYSGSRSSYGGDHGRSYFMRRMMESAASSGQTADVMLIPDTRLKWVVAIMKPSLKPEVDALIKQFDVEKTQELQVRAIDLKGGNAAALAATISRVMVTDEDDPAGTIRVSPSDDNARLFVTSNEANYKMVQELIETIGIAPANRAVEIYKLTNAQASSIVSIINSVISGKGLGSVGAGGSSSLSPFSRGSDYSGGGEGRRSFYSRMGFGGSSSYRSGLSGAGQSSDVMLIPESRLNWVIAIVKPELKAEVDALIKQFDVQRTLSIKTHAIELKGGNATRMASTLDRLIDDYINDFLDDNNPNSYVRISASDDNARLIVVSNDENFKMVEEMVNSIAVVNTDRVVEVYKLTYAQAPSIIQVVNSVITNRGLGSVGTAGSSGGSSFSDFSRGGGDGEGRRSFYSRMMSMGGAGGSGPQNVDVLMIPDARLNWVITIMKPELKKEVDALIKQFDVEKTRQVQARTIDLKNGNASAISNTVMRLLSDSSSSNDPADFLRVTPTDDNSHLLVMSTEARFKEVEELVTTISSVPNNRIVETYKLTYADASQIASTINSIITNKGKGSTSVAASQGSMGSMGSRFASGGDSSAYRSSFFRRMMDTMSSGGGQSADVMLIPDARLNWLVAIMKPEFKAELDELVKQFDVDTSKDVTARMIEIKNSTAPAMAMMVNNLIQDKIQNSNNPRDAIRVTPADDGLRLVVMSSQANFEMIQGLVDTLDNVPDDRVVDVYKLAFADASELTALLNNVISKSPMMKGSMGGSTLPVGGMSGSSSSNSLGRYSRFLSSGLGRFGSSSSLGSLSGGPSAVTGAIQVGNIILIPDTRLNWIVTICPKDQKTELDALVKQFDIERPKDFQGRVIEVKHVDANDLAQNINSIMQQQALTGGRREAVRVSSTDDGQRLLVWSTEANFKDIQEMVKTLDVDMPKDVQARMIEIKFAEATTLATTINNLFRDSFFMGGYGSGGKREFVRVSATEDGQRMMVMSSEANFKIIEEMVKQLDTKDSESLVPKVFKIEHLEAQALADQLSQLFQERARAQTSNAMFGVFGGYGYSGGRSGSTVATMPSIVPSPRTNTIMVMARPKDQPFIEQMIKELDVPINAEDFEPRIYHIRNTDASEVVSVLQNLFEGRATSARTTNINYYLNSWRPNSGSANQDEIAAVFGKLRFVVDRVTNTIVVLSSNTKNYEIIDRVVEKLDAPDPENSEVMIFTLKYADALKLADQLNYLFSEGSVQRPNPTPTTQRTTTNQNNNGNGIIGGDDTINALDEEIERDFVPLWGTSQVRAGESERPINTMIGKVRVVPDIRSNKLTVAAPPVYFTTLKSLIESLDHPEPQVYITTRIVEITRGKERRIGLRWTPDPKSIDPAELDNAVMALGQLGFMDSFGNGNGESAIAAKRTLTAVGGGTVGGVDLTQTLKNGNSVISTNVNLALLLQLLTKNSQSRIYSEPGVTVNNNETGNIFFGSEYPFRTNSQISYNGTQTYGVAYRPVGINLDIRPHINSSDEIVLKVAGENSNVRAELIDGQIVKDMRRFTTEVSLKSGETMVIGGILIDDGVKTKRGVPVLGNLPLLKYVFGKNDEERNLRELVFFVTPEVLQTSADTRRIVDSTQDKIDQFESIDGKNIDRIQSFEAIPDKDAAGRKYRVSRTIKADLPSNLPEVQDEQPADAPQATITSDDQPAEEPKRQDAPQGIIVRGTPVRPAPVPDAPPPERSVIKEKPVAQKEE